jgi:hypothetical protein
MDIFDGVMSVAGGVTSDGFAIKSVEVHRY